ncbi:hypothetical protein H072_2647 [Dactylellina haptotyla CBS 200.50]|uniref:F-box domain-containing protein n=1 Tax=Dactylellina haptotyla (strain CBS 200.50) TaxID=1284197 RepID=S8AKC7_DACHA|nr:hypothetical protein H072_2647 [Dactylellina haptotyla CBS 200.50]
MGNLAELPGELLQQILSLLYSTTDLANFGRSCKRLYEWSIPYLNRTLKITTPSRMGGDEEDIKRAFAKASTSISLQHLCEIDLIRPSDGDSIRIEPRHLFITPKGFARQEMNTLPLFNIYLRQLLAEIPQGQLKTFYYRNLNSKNRIGGNQELESYTLSMIFHPRNTITRLYISFPDTISINCDMARMPHLKQLEFQLEDAVYQYHMIFNLLHSCQNTLEELRCHNQRHAAYQRDSFAPGYSLPANGIPPPTYMRIGYDEWLTCNGCRLGQGGRKKIRMTALKLWRIDGMGIMMTDLFHYHNIVKAVPVTDIEIATETLAFAGLRTKDSTLEIDSLLRLPREYLDAHPSDNEKQYSEALEDYFSKIKGLTHITLNFHGKTSLGWLGSLKQHADSLRQLHVASVYGTVVFRTDDIEMLGKNLQNLEMLTVKTRTPFPPCVLDAEIFPKLKYFFDRLYPESVITHDKKIQAVITMIQEKVDANTLSKNLRLLYFGYGRNRIYIDRLDGGKAVVRELAHGDWEYLQVVQELGGEPRFA